MFKIIIAALALTASYAVADDITIEHGQLQLNQALAFETQSDVLLPESQTTIQQIKTFLDNKSYISTLRIEGHVNSLSDEEQNQLSSAKRGLSVAKALIDAGVDCQRLLVSAFGSSKPVAENNTPEGKAANNRIDLVIAALRGRAIGGMPLEGVGQKVAEACNK